MSRKHNTVIAEPVPVIKTAGSAKAVTINYIKVNPMVWRVVMQLSAGIKDRIEIHSDISVTVHNNGDWRKRVRRNEVDETS